MFYHTYMPLHMMFLMYRMASHLVTCQAEYILLYEALV